jgi:hypothetical protein
VDLVNLRTGKPHISFSELNSWVSCSWRHKLQQIDKIILDTRGPALDFGTAIHSACENFLKTRVMNPQIAVDAIRIAWETYGHPDVEEWILQAEGILADVPAWMEANFPKWRYIKAEEMLYEPIDGKPHAFKGFIDGVIVASKLVRKKMKTFVWLIDWKTTSWGWMREKKQDPATRVQLIYYKNYWCKKRNVDPKDVKCAFALLKRIAKPGEHCELLPVSVGPLTTDRALKTVSNMIHSVQKGLAYKNRHNCKWCPYFETEHCTWMPPSRFTRASP